jgi:hypothetical protein
MNQRCCVVVEAIGTAWLKGFGRRAVFELYADPVEDPIIDNLSAHTDIPPFSPSPPHAVMQVV